MYAVVRTGGKQYRVGAGDIIEVEKLAGDVGDEITLDDVLLVSNGDRIEIGQPVVEGANVSAVITGQYRGPKVLSFRYRPKKRIRVRRGHRQHLTRLEIKSVGLGGETFSDAMELGPTPTNATLPKKRNKKSKGIATVAATAAAAGVVDEVVSDADGLDTENMVEESIVDAADTVTEGAADVVETATDAADSVVEETTEAVNDVVEGVTDAAEDAAETITDAASDAAESAADAASDVADAASDAVDTDN